MSDRTERPSVLIARAQRARRAARASTQEVPAVTTPRRAPLAALADVYGLDREYCELVARRCA